MSKTGLNQTNDGLILSYFILNMPLATVLLGAFFLDVPTDLEGAQRGMAPQENKRFSELLHRYRCPPMLQWQ
ncbi:MAG: hypothetical protein DSY55_02450 [Clostridia bacterium]|nr:MAG: hypothetical protein DSY55_02450 [Clostridia bacterium]